MLHRIAPTTNMMLQIYVDNMQWGEGGARNFNKVLIVDVKFPEE